MVVPEEFIVGIVTFQSKIPRSLQILYLARLDLVNLDGAKAPGLNDRKRVHITNIDPFAIVQPRELSRRPNLLNQAARGIQQLRSND